MRELLEALNTITILTANILPEEEIREGISNDQIISLLQVLGIVSMKCREMIEILKYGVVE